jgi:hypothetical protein
MDPTNSRKNGRVRMLAHDDHRTVIFPQTLTRMCKECGFKVISHETDIDTIRMSTSPIKRNAKLVLWFFSDLLFETTVTAEAVQIFGFSKIVSEGHRL